MEDKGLSVAEALALRNGENDMFGNNGCWWIIIFFMFFIFGNGGFFGYGNNAFAARAAASDGIMENYTLNSDFANIERKIDGVNNGLCDGFYAQNTSTLNGIEKITSNVDRGLAGVNSTVTNSAFDIRNAIQQSDMIQMQNMNSLQNQLAGYHFDTKNSITNVGYGLKDAITNGNIALNESINNVGYGLKDSITGIGCGLKDSITELGFGMKDSLCHLNYNLSNNSNMLQNTIQNSSFNTERQIERGFCDTNFNLLTQNNTTLQAIDKVGDRIIDYLANEKVQNLRDENQTLKLAASQCAQNNYLISQLSQPVPKPAYLVCNPNGALNYSFNCNQTPSCGCM